MTGIYQLANFVSNLAISSVENHTAIQANPFLSHIVSILRQMISTTKRAISTILLLSLFARSTTANFWRGLSKANETDLYDLQPHVTVR
jgi:hypothetical protein